MKYYSWSFTCIHSTNRHIYDSDYCLSSLSCKAAQATQRNIKTSDAAFGHTSPLLAGKANVFKQLLNNVSYVATFSQSLLNTDFSTHSGLTFISLRSLCNGSKILWHQCLTGKSQVSVVKCTLQEKQKQHCIWQQSRKSQWKQHPWRLNRSLGWRHKFKNNDRVTDD